MASAFGQVDRSLLDASATLGASRLRTFRQVIVPLSRDGILTAAVLAFAHTIGEFGVVLMVGGNLPGVTRTVSISIYDDVQSLNLPAAHLTSLCLLLFSFLALTIVYGVTRRPWSAAPQ
jgi:molybdate transport system permease protein